MENSKLKRGATRQSTNVGLGVLGNCASWSRAARYLVHTFPDATVFSGMAQRGSESLDVSVLGKSFRRHARLKKKWKEWAESERFTMI